MSLLLSAWHFFPWWTLPLLVVAIVAFTYFGLWPVAIRLARLVPWPVYAIVAVGIAGGLWLTWHDDELTAEVTASVTAARDKYWRDREDASNAAHAAAVSQLNLRLANALDTARLASAEHARKLVAERLKREAAEAALAKERSTNVTAAADRACVVTAGVVRQFNLAAAVANRLEAGDDAGAPGPRPVDVDAPSGVAISEISRANDDNAGAFRACRARVDDWESYHATVIKPWIASTLEALQFCIPKGSP